MKILVVEDDRRIAAFLERGLTAEGYQVSVEHDGRDGLERARQGDFDIVILDRMLPYVDGLEIARLLREERRGAMILMLTAKDSLADKIEGLKGGADDYLTKPFAFDELLARLVALGRRRGEASQETALKCGPLLLDPQSRSDTYPYIEIDEDDVTIGHEASVSKVGEEQLFYLMSRGLSEEEATTMVVSGFIEPLVKELPMEYAVEMNRLIALQMEGSIG